MILCVLLKIACDMCNLCHRKARIDAPGALHHVIVRGTQRGKIFRSDYDRQNFLNRLGKLIPEMQTDCFAWTLIPNHIHLLLR